MKEKFLQGVFATAMGMISALHTSVNFLIPCFIAIIIDIISAWRLDNRIAKRYKKTNGKFKSSHICKVLLTFIYVFLAIIASNYVDNFILISTNQIATRVVTAIFLFYTIWSVLENWSSCNGNKFAKVLQHIMIDKTERHLGVDLHELEHKENRKKDE